MRRLQRSKGTLTENSRSWLRSLKISERPSTTALILLEEFVSVARKASPSAVRLLFSEGLQLHSLKSGICPAPRSSVHRSVNLRDYCGYDQASGPHLSPSVLLSDLSRHIPDTYH